MWISLCPILEGSGICHHLLPLHLSNVLAGEDGIGRWQEVLSDETQWSRWGPMVILHLVYLTCPFGELKQGPHLLYQLFAVLHLWYCQQLSPPARCFASFIFPSHPLMELFHWGFGRGHLSSSSEFLADPSEEAGNLHPQFWWLLQVRVFGIHCLSIRL